MQASQAVPQARTSMASTPELGAEVRQSALLLGLVLATSGLVTLLCCALQLVT